MSLFDETLFDEYACFSIVDEDMNPCDIVFNFLSFPFVGLSVCLCVFQYLRDYHFVHSRPRVYPLGSLVTSLDLLHGLWLVISL